MSTLRDLLQKMSDIDNDMVADIDPGELVGEIRGKVDSIKHVIDRLESFAGFLKDRIEPLAKARSSVTKNIKRLEEYVKFQMQMQSLERLPGEEYYIRLIEKQERLVFQAQPDAADALRYPDYVQISRVFSWNEEKIHNDLLSGVLSGFPMAKFERSNYIRFFTEKGQKDGKPTANGTGKRNAKRVSAGAEGADPSGAPETP